MSDANEILKRFKYDSNRAIRKVEALRVFLKNEIAFGRIKGGEKLPGMVEISKITGLSFGQARNVIESLCREGYACSRRHVGTVAVVRKDVLRGRVLITYPDVDVCRYYPTQLFDTLNSKLNEAGFAVSFVSFPLEANRSLAQLKSELLRGVDCAIALRATPRVQKLIADSRVKYVFAYGDKPMHLKRGGFWVPFSLDGALAQFAADCEKAGVKRVLQVRFQKDELLDAGPALAEKGIETSWFTIPGKDIQRGRFADIVHRACEKFTAMKQEDFPDLMLFWDVNVAQGAIMAFLKRGVRIPEDVKIVSLSEAGFAPCFIEPVTRIEVDSVIDGESISRVVLDMFDKGYALHLPVITPQYIYGATFPCPPPGESPAVNSEIGNGEAI